MKTMMTERETKQTAMAVVIAMVLGAIIALVAILFFSKPAHGEESKVISGSFVIGGYEPKKFAVDLIKRELIDACFQDIKADSPKIGEYNLKVLVIGSADTTGVSAENDPLSKNRAEPVAALLRYYLPQGTQVEVVPRGDSENARQVRVEWKYVPIPVKPDPVVSVPETKASAKEFFSVWMWAGGIIAIIVAVGLCVFLFRKGMTKESQIGPGIQWLDLEVMGEKYSVKVEFQDKIGLWYSPFTSKAGGHIWRDSKRGIIESLKGCLKKEEFSQQKIDLIGKRIIKIAGK